MQPSGDRDRPVRSSSPPVRARVLLCGAGACLLGLAALAGCSSGGATNGVVAGGTPAAGSSTFTSAVPGKFQALPQPCGSVGRGTLTSLLPGADYAGTAALTYDTDRRVGCTWSTTSDGGQGGSRYLTIDLERVVSYDPAVSDDAQAERDYQAKATAAGIPSASASAASSAAGQVPAAASASGAASRPPDTAAAAAASRTGRPSGSASGSADAAGPEATPGSRTLAGLGDDAFLDDEPVTRDSGVHRDITLVFREANVLITVELSQWSGDRTAVPASAALQEGAWSVAQEIAQQFD